MPPYPRARYTSPNHSSSSSGQRRFYNYAGDPNLPEEAKKYLITVEKLVTMGKGSLADSRWAPIEDKIKAGIIKADSQEPISPPSSTRSSESNKSVQLPSKGLKASVWASPSPFDRQPTTHVASASQPTLNQNLEDSTEKFFARLAAKNITLSPPNATARGCELDEETKQNGSVTSDRSTSTSPFCKSLDPKAQAFTPSPTQPYAVPPHLREPEQKAQIIPQEPVVFKDAEPKLPPITQDSVDQQSTEQSTESTPQEGQTQIIPQQPVVLKDTARTLRSTQQESTILPHLRGLEHTTQSIAQKTIIQRDSELKSKSIHHTPTTPPHLRVAGHITQPIAQESIILRDTEQKSRNALPVSVVLPILKVTEKKPQPIPQQSSILRYFKVAEQRSQTLPHEPVVHRDTAQNIQSSYEESSVFSDLAGADPDPPLTSQEPAALSESDQKSQSTPDPEDPQHMQGSEQNTQTHPPTNATAVAPTTMVIRESKPQYLPPHLKVAEAKMAPNTKADLTTLQKARNAAPQETSKAESTILPHLRGAASKPLPGHRAETAISPHTRLPQTGNVMTTHTSVEPNGYNPLYLTGAEPKITSSGKAESTSMSHVHKVKVENTPLHSVAIRNQITPITQTDDLPPHLRGMKVEDTHLHSVANSNHVTPITQVENLLPHIRGMKVEGNLLYSAAKSNDFTPINQTNNLPPHPRGIKVKDITFCPVAQSSGQTHLQSAITATRENNQSQYIGFSTPQKQKPEQFDTLASVSSNDKSIATSGGGVDLRGTSASPIQNLPPHLRYYTPRTLAQKTTSPSPNHVTVKKGAVTSPESENVTNGQDSTSKANAQRSPATPPIESASSTPNAKMQGAVRTSPTTGLKAEIDPDEWLNKAAAVRKARQQAQTISANPRANAFTNLLISLSKSSDNDFQVFLDRKKNTPAANATIYTLKGEAQKQKEAPSVVASPVELPNPNFDTKMEEAPSNMFANANETRKAKIPHEYNVPFTKTGAATVKPVGKENVNPIIQNFPSPDVKSTEPRLEITYAKALAEKQSSTAADSSDGWGSLWVQDAKILQHMILKDVKAVQTITTKGDKLTEDALAKASGFIPRNYSNSFEAGISDAGVGELPEEPKGSVLWKQGKPAEEELLDWDGSWLPPPCDWDDRGTHDKSYMPSLIQEWQKNKEVPCGPGFELDTSLLHYKNGHPPCNGFFSKTDESPVCIPDIENSEDEQKRLEQTSKSSSENFVKNQQKNRKFAKEMAIVHEIHNEKILALEPEVDLYSPKIDVYLRPAGKEDSAGIAMVYNHHIATTFITEDQAPVTEDDIEFMIENAKKENLPFIVAIRGQAPRLQDSLGRRTASKKAAMPKCEMVIGFATAEIYNYGLGGARTGRSRSTANLMLYVHPEYKRKGVGRNLLDRLVHNMSPGYGYRKACSWLNPENDTVHESGGPGHFHQILFQLPVLPKDDPNLAWIKNFLYNGYFFTEEARLKSIGRSRATPGPAKWLDVVVFQGQAYQAEEFDPHDYCLVAGVQRSA